MRVFCKLTTLSMQRQMYYKASFFINILTPLILLLGRYMLWDALYLQQGSNVIGSITQKEMNTHILIAFALNNLLNWSSENTLAKEIRSGSIVARLIRPVTFLSQYISEMTGAIILQGIFNALMVLIFFIVFGQFMHIPTLEAFFISIPCIFLALCLRIMMIDIFSLLCFFCTSYLGISWTRIALFDFFSGSLIPIAMFPLWLNKITYLTPFPYMLQVPIVVLLEQELPLSYGMMCGIQLMWLGIFVVLHCAIYGYAKKHMTIAGG